MKNHFRITCHDANRYFEICKRDHDIPTYEGLKEYARACHG